MSHPAACRNAVKSRAITGETAANPICQPGQQQVQCHRSVPGPLRKGVLGENQRTTDEGRRVVVLLEPCPAVEALLAGRPLSAGGDTEATPPCLCCGPPDLALVI